MCIFALHNVVHALKEKHVNSNLILQFSSYFGNNQ